MTQAVKAGKAGGSGRMVTIITMFFLFAMISFVTNLAAPIGTIWKNHYEWAGMFGNLMNFLAYLFMGIPAGNMLVKYGYKKTALVALALGAIGMGLQLLSSYWGAGINTFSVSGDPVELNYMIYLLGAFICGFCVCMLNTVVNPMLNIIGGGGNKGNQMIQGGNACNSLAGTLTPFFVGMLIGQVTPATTLLEVSPLLIIACCVFVVSFLIISFVKIPEPPRKNIAKAKKEKYSAWSFRHLVLGVCGIFLYVGIEVGIPAEMIFYLSDSEASGIEVNAMAVATAVAAVYWLLMLVGRLVSSAISGKVSSRTQLIATTSTAIVLVILAIIMPSGIRVSVPSYSSADGFSMAQVPISALFLVLCGLCTSVMWGSIFNLAVEGLGRFTEQASGIFMMMVVGGGVMPLIQEQIGRSVSYMASYWLVVAMLAYLLYYALIGCKNVNKYIPVDAADEGKVMDSL